jgi:radical SAM protein with 4Fe4S-binding SPASM domain
MRDVPAEVSSSPRLLRVLDAPRPQYVVWELTLRCDQRCVHCGSRAGLARDGELTTEEALDVVRQLAALGAEEVALIGGEAYLHDGIFAVLRALGDAGIRPTMTTGGRGVTRELAEQLAAAGLHSVSVSVDGLEPTHDRMRGAGSFAATVRAFGHLRGAGLTTLANTQINRANASELEALYEHVRAMGIATWQVQQTVPLGRAADRPELILQPYDLLDVIPRLARLKARAFGDGILLMPSSPLGYFGPEEGLLRGLAPDRPSYYPGCQAGKAVMGIESDGAVKGCPSLQTRHYVGGRVRESRLEEIWARSPVIGFNRGRTVDDLWGFCRACPFAATCMGGCTFTAHAILGRIGNNPMCHFRARALAREGLRERLVPVERAPGEPFDNGRFDIVVEPLDAPEPSPPSSARLRVVS